MVVTVDDFLEQGDEEGRQIDTPRGGITLRRSEPQLSTDLVQGPDVGVDEEISAGGVAVGLASPLSSPQRMPVNAALITMA